MTTDNSYTKAKHETDFVSEASAVPGNPVVRLTSPTKNQLVGYRTTVRLQAEVSDASGIEKVEFYNGELKLGEAQEAPYECSWKDVQDGTFYVSARAIDKAGNAVHSAVVPIHANYLSLEAPWASQDIGSPAIMGAATKGTDGRSIMVKGAGAIQGSADAFQYTYQRLEGDGEIIAKVESNGLLPHSAVGGLMIRETLEADSPFAAISVSCANSDKLEKPYSTDFLYRLQKREAAVVPLTHVESQPNMLDAAQQPVWLKLQRTGDDFTGYASADGISWTRTGAQTIAMAKDVFVGMAVDAAQVQLHAPERYNAVKYSNVSLTGDAQPIVITYANKPNDTVMHADQLIGGFVNKPAHISIELNGIAVGVPGKKNANEVWSQTVTLKKGRNALTITVKNDRGGVQSIHQEIVYIGQPHAVVDAAYTGMDGEAVNGVPAFKSLQAAINAVPAANGQRFIIFIKNGVYKELIVVDKPFVSLLGESAEGTFITYDNAAGTPKEGGGTLGTTGSTSTLIQADDFTAENLTFENSFDESIPYGGKQAVALKAEGDRLIFKNVHFLGNQDTLYPNKGRQYYADSYVEGDIDFIFGAAQAVFDNTVLRTTHRGSTTNNGYISAASTDMNEKYGYLFNSCRLISDSPANTVALGRPWHPGGNPNAIASVVFKNCYMGDHISEKGWDDMGGFSAADARLAEYGSTGPGARASATRKVLTDDEAAEYTTEQVLKGWNPTAALLELYASVL